MLISIKQRKLRLLWGIKFYFLYRATIVAQDSSKNVFESGSWTSNWNLDQGYIFYYQQHYETENAEPQKPLKFWIFTNIWCFSSNFVGYQYFIESKSTDIISSWGTNLKD